MVEKLFLSSISAFLILLIAGIVGAELSGSDKAFDIRPAMSVLKGVWGVGERTANGEVVADGEDPDPFGEVADRARRRIIGHLEKGFDNIPDDPRLAGCPAGSIELGQQQIEFNTAKKLVEQHQQSPFKSLIDVQVALKTPPHCNYRVGDRTIWKFTVTGFRVLKAIEADGQVEFELDK